MTAPPPQTPPPGERDERPVEIWPAAIVLLVTVALTWPLGSKLSSAIPAYTRALDEDLLSNIWSVWWARSALLEGRGSLLFTRYMLHPDGVTLTMSAIAPSVTAALAPIAGLFPGIAGVFVAWNLNVLATFFLSGLGGYLLTRRVVGSPWAALAGGLIFAFSPYRYDHLRHVDLSCTQWLPFVFWTLLGRLEGGGWHWSVGLAASLALVLTSSATYTAQLAVFGPVFVLAWMVSRSDDRAVRLARLGSLILPVCLAILLAAPVLLPTLSDLALVPFETPTRDDPVRFSYPIEAFVTAGMSVYVGLSMVMLAIVAMTRVRGSGPWASVALLGLALAPGPVLKTVNGVTSVPLPYELLRDLVPVFHNNRFCERFLVFWWLGASVLAGQALAWLGSRTLRPRAWAVALGAMILIDLRPERLVMYRPAVPAIYERLAGAPPGWPVYEWPANYLSNRKFMFYQMVHGRPICQGVVSRRPLLSYLMEEHDAASTLESMILVLHHDLVPDEGHRRKLSVLMRRYDTRRLAVEGSCEALLLTRRRTGPSR